MVFIIKMRCEKVEFWWEIASDRRLMTHDCIYSIPCNASVHPASGPCVNTRIKTSVANDINYR